MSERKAFVKKFAQGVIWNVELCETPYGVGVRAHSFAVLARDWVGGSRLNLGLASVASTRPEAEKDECARAHSDQ